MRKLLLSGLAALAGNAAMAADLPIPGEPAPVRVPVLSPVLYDWTAFYFGVNGSWTATHSDITVRDVPTGAIFAPSSDDRGLFHGGGQIGFDYMFPSRVVLGAVVDLDSGSNHTATNSLTLGPPALETIQTKINAIGTVRGRLGYAFDTLLFYGTGGWAWESGSANRTQVFGTVNLAAPGTVETASVSNSGWTAGAGVAWAFARSWDGFVEYRYTSFQNKTVTFPLAGQSTTFSNASSTIEVGVNYRLDWWNRPQTVRY
jgi:opacity protein-like surface antigen